MKDFFDRRFYGGILGGFSYRQIAKGAIVCAAFVLANLAIVHAAATFCMVVL